MTDVNVKLLGINLLQVKKTQDVFKLSMFGIRLISKYDPAAKHKQMQADVEDVPLEPQIIKLCLREGGGLGDSLFQLVYLKELRKMFKCPVRIDFYCRGYKAFQDVPFIDNTMKYTSDQDLSKYDIIITSRRLWQIIINSEDKVKELAPEFYDFYCKNNAFITEAFANEWSDATVTTYAKLFNKNRFEQPNIHNFLNVDRNTPKYLSWDESAFGILDVYGLKRGNYITICRAVDIKYNSNHPKLWPLEYYNELIHKIKSKYPDIKIVQVGSDISYGAFDGVDLCLCGQTSLEQIKVLLKYSLLHIDGEGGLVHMKRFLNGISVVLFGPTSPEVYGYEENINIYNQICPISCCQISRQWANECMKEHVAPAPCMKCLTPTIVFKAISEYLKQLPRHAYKVKIKQNVILKNFIKDKSVAVYGRPDKSMLQMLKLAKSVMIYDRDLAIDDQLYPKNCEYLSVVNRNNWEAEFATPYNIPAHDNTYDHIIVCEKEISHLEDAVAEWLRILKPSGNLFFFPKQDVNIRDMYIKSITGAETAVVTKVK